MAAVIALGRLLRRAPVACATASGDRLKSSPASCSDRRCSAASRRRWRVRAADSITPALTLIAQIGVVLYMFLVGLELNLDRVRLAARMPPSRSRTRASWRRSSSAPTLALYLYPRFSTSDVPFTSFALFIGVAMSITAFPVLARILTDRGMTHSSSASSR